MSTRKSFIFLLLASVFCAAAWLAHGWAQQGRTQAQQALQGLEQTRGEIEQLRTDLGRWEAASARWGGTQATGRVEPVALQAAFLPSELQRSAALLAGLYADHGHFQLEHFSLSRGQEEAMTEQVRMEVRGVKVFNVTQATVVLLPNPDGSVGQVVVTGHAGQQVLGAAFTGTDLTGAAPAVAVPEEQVRRVFGDALKAQPQRPERFTLFFEDGSVNLTQASAAEWPQVLQRLRARTALDLTVAGHTDTIGSTQSNEALALRRAQMIAQRLRDSGLQDTEIAIEGFGERLLEVPTRDGVREARNRRVVISAR